MSNKDYRKSNLIRRSKDVVINTMTLRVLTFFGLHFAICWYKKIILSITLSFNNLKTLLNRMFFKDAINIQTPLNEMWWAQKILPGTEWTYCFNDSLIRICKSLFIAVILSLNVMQSKSHDICFYPNINQRKKRNAKRTKRINSISFRKAISFVGCGWEWTKWWLSCGFQKQYVERHCNKGRNGLPWQKAV